MFFKKRPIKLCVDCKWYSATKDYDNLHVNDSQGHRCKRPLGKTEVMLVIGGREDKFENERCWFARRFDCGKKAKYFEPKVSDVPQ